MGVGVFVTGLSQMSSFFSFSLDAPLVRLHTYTISEPCCTIDIFDIHSSYNIFRDV